MDTPPLGPVPYLPPTHVCADHEGDRYSGIPCPNCRPLTPAELDAHRAAFLAEHPDAIAEEEPF